MMNSSRSSALRKYCAGVVAVALFVQPMGAYAAKITTSSLAEVPLQGLNPVKPNIMLTVDDSGSMLWDFVPDFAGFAGAGNTHCRDGQFQCGGLPTSNTFLFNGYVATQYDPPIRSSGQNKQYYDPTATYLVGKTFDGTNLPYESANPGTWTSVYVDGFAGYPGPNNGGTRNLTTGYPDTAWCNSQASAPPSATDLATAFGNGSKCRLNGRTYGPFTEPSNLWSVPSIAAGYNYPNVKNVATGSNTACGAANEYCIFSTPAAVSGNPYYYTISNVQYCSNKDAAGFGTGLCQARFDNTTYKYVRYGNDPAKSFDPTAFTRVDIVPATPTYPSGRTYPQEMTNFAKWYTFYRTRILGMKTAAGIAFSALSEENARVGFHTLWENNSATAGFLNVTPFSGPLSNPPSTNKPTWFNHLYAVAPNFSTPLPDAMWRIGELFSGNAGATGLPGATDPLDATTGMCQSNYHLLSTDGYWNIVPQNSVGDRDQTVPATPGAVPGFTPGALFPRPYYQGPQAMSNNLADLAMYYWIRDLRPALPDKVKDSVAPWQHVTVYGLSIGAQGTLPYPGGIADVTSGVKDWPTMASGSPGQDLSASGLAGAERIDDLWHAAINSRGKYLNAASPQQLAESIVSALADFIGTQAGTGTAVGIAGTQFSTTKKYGYRTSYEGGWWGDVRKYALDPSTGALPVDAAGNPTNAPLWSATTQLDTMAAGTGWDTNRRIVTIKDDDKAVIPFRLASLATSQKNSLANAWSTVASPPTDQQVLDYLRGDKSNEGTGTTNFRARSHILGDIVYSGAVPVGAPGQPYDDVGNPGYTAFATSKQSRTPMVYVGANDGMMHAIDDSTTANAGKETWAFVPRALFSSGNPNDTQFDPLSMESIGFQLGALTYRSGGIPLFSHKFYVNATPRVWDIDFAYTNTKILPTTGNDWRTILVGGLGAGGKSIYALDVTTPVVATESEAAIASSGRVLWEFTDENLGYVFDPPTLVKTQRYGWVVLATSGYNNKDGDGKLFVINPTDGTLLKTLSTGVGSDSDPSGLSTIRAYTPSRKDPYVLQAYGGDLKGNVWRFDLSDPDETNWKVELIAQLTDGVKAQPITTGIRIEIDQNNNVDRYLFVGTGQLLDQKDLNDTAAAKNTLYVIRDGTRTAAEPAPLTPYSRANLNPVVAGQVAGITGTPTGRGWYQDASDPKEKIGTDVFADVQTVVYSFSKPSDDPCEGALTSNLFARDLNTGNSVLQSAGGTVVASVGDIGAIAGVALIQGQAGTGSSASGDVRAQVTTMKGQVFSFGVNLAGAAAAKHRVSWRLLNRD